MFSSVPFLLNWLKFLSCSLTSSHYSLHWLWLNYCIRVIKTWWCHSSTPHSWPVILGHGLKMLPVSMIYAECIWRNLIFVGESFRLRTTIWILNGLVYTSHISFRWPAFTFQKFSLYVVLAACCFRPKYFRLLQLTQSVTLCLDFLIQCFTLPGL